MNKKAENHEKSINDSLLVNPIDINKSIKKTRIKFIMQIFAYTLISAAIIFYFVPSIFQGIYYSKMDSYTRMMANLTQFKIPVSIIGNISKPQLFQTEVGIINSAYISNGTGVNLQNIESTYLKVPSTKLELYDVGYGSSFYINPPSNNMDEINSILMHNPNQTAIINISLKNPKTLEEIKEFISKYHINISWLAVTTELEYSHSSNITMEEGSQYRQFGFPTKTLFYNTWEEKVLDYNSPNEYLEFIKGEWEWTIKNKDLVKNSKDMLIFKEMEHALLSDLQIYGITVIGTTDVLSEMCNDEEIAYGVIAGFYPWDIIK